MVTGMATTSQISRGSLGQDNGRPGSPACLAFLCCLYWQRQRRAPRKTTLHKLSVEIHNRHENGPPAAGEGAGVRGANTVRMKVGAKYRLAAVSVEFYSQIKKKKHHNVSGEPYRKEGSRAPTVALMKNPMTILFLWNITSWFVAGVRTVCES